MEIGVFLCECGGNISNTVDLEKVKNHINATDDDVFVTINSHMCSGAGQKLILTESKKQGLDKIVVAACSPHFHEKTFRGVMERAGLNPYMLEVANFREHCSWSHKKNPEKATEKAKDVVDMAIAKVNLDYLIKAKKMKLGNKVLVIGGGIAGLQSSLHLANSGKKVILVEKQPTIGGKMTILTKTFPTEDCAACILSPKMADVKDHKNIQLITNAEITNLAGHRLHFEAKITEHPRYIKDSIDTDQCLICNKCTDVCPVDEPNYWEQGIIDRKAIYIPAPHAIPYNYLIDRENCLHFVDGSCSKCEEVCPQNVIDFEQKDKTIETSVDSVLIATGYDIFDASQKPVYGYEKSKNIVTSLEMERIVDHISEKEPPRPVGDKIAFIQCVGSRDEQIGREYCSRVCCMYSVKLASLLKQAKPEKEIYIFYTDLRAFGKGYEEYYKRAQKMGITFVRGKPAEIVGDKETGKVTVTVEDTLSRQIIESEFDLVVLANGLELNKSTEPIVDFLKISKSEDGFLKEAHPKYKPVDTQVEGVFLAGVAQGPKDIPDAVNQAGAAAARIIETLAQKEVSLDPVLAFVHQDVCDGCEECLSGCPKQAISMDENGKASVTEALCLGCGSCIASCPLEAIDLHYNTNEQLYAEIDAVLKNKNSDERKILIFADNNTTYRLIDACGVRKMSYSTDTRVFRIPSGSRVTPKLMMHSFKKGADAVIITDTPKKNSPYTWANEWTMKNISEVKAFLRKNDIDEGRLQFFKYKAGELAKFISDIDEISQQLDKMDNSG